MKTLPTPDRLARLVSNVTETMLGISFRADVARQARVPLICRTATLRIPGARPLTVGLSSDAAGCVALGAALFAAEAGSVDQEMIDDSLRELVNMTAGLLKTLLGLDQLLGLPRIVEAALEPELKGSHTVVLRAEQLGLVLWVAEGGF